MKKLFSYLYNRQRLRFTCTLLFTIFSSLFEVALAYIMMQCVDLAMDGSLSEAMSFAFWLIFYLITYFIVDYLAKRLKWKTLQIAQMNLRNDVTQSIMAMPINHFHLKNTSGWLAMITTQCDMIEESYFKMWFNVFSELFSFIVSSVILCFISPWLALFVFVTACIQMLVPKIIGPMIAKKRSKQMDAAENFTITTTEHLNGFDLLKSFNLTAQSLQAICEANSQWEDTKLGTRMYTSVARLLSFTFGQIIYVGIFFFGALLTIKGGMTVGTMVVASQLVVYIASPLQTLSEDLTDIKSVKELIASLRKEISSSETSLKQPIQNITSFEEIDFQNVSFSYDDMQVFNAININIVRGNRYLLCGPSGCGKSTLIKLLTGVECPASGKVKIDDIDIQTLSPEELARFILPCTQSTFIFNASLRDNVTLFDNHFSDEEIIAVLNKVEFTYVLERYDDGLNHMIKQGGQSLSGGERQKVALARMELFNPPVVIFDESFANLDVNTAERLMKLVLQDNQRTVIVVAHQLTEELTRLFDKRLLIENKKVIVEDLWKE